MDQYKRLHLFDLKKGKVKTIDDWDSEKLSVLGGEEMMKKAVVVSETERELKVLDPDSYKTVTVLKPDNLSIQEDEIKTIKIDGELYPISEKED